MPEPQDIRTGVQLLVEGNDPRNFFEALVRHMERDDIQVRNFGGVNELRGFLSAFVAMPGFGETVRSLGIVRDAEADARGAFQSVQSRLRNAGLPVPDAIDQRAEGPPSVSALILPGDGRPGMLETLLCETFAGSAEDDCVTEFLDCASELPGASVTRPDKARAHAWLATQPEPHFSVGYAAQRGYWDLDHPTLGGVRDFLRSL